MLMKISGLIEKATFIKLESYYCSLKKDNNKSHYNSIFSPMEISFEFRKVFTYKRHKQKEKLKKKRENIKETEIGDCIYICI